MPKLTVHVPTAEEEFSSLLYVLGRLPFYRKEGYSVTLPSHSGINDFLGKPTLSKADKDELWELFSDEIYDAKLFDKGKAVLEKKSEGLDRLFSKLTQLKQTWGFKVYPEYQVLLSAYGSEGRYEPATGSIVVVVNSDGTIKDPQPMNTIIHEIVHLGIQKNIVEHFRLSHWEKEQLVDLICLKELTGFVPGYELQEGGEEVIDHYVNDEAFLDFPSAVAKFVEDRRRS